MSILEPLPGAAAPQAGGPVRRDDLPGTGTYAVLASDWLLRGYSDRPAVLYNWRSGEVHNLSRTGAHVACSCDGATDFTAPYFLPEHAATLALMLERGMAVSCTPGTALDERQRLRTAPNRYLRFIHWAVTGRCNLSCRHCYIDAPTARYGELPSETAFRIVDEMECANVQRVHLSGGEPLLRDDIWEIVAALAERRIGVDQISTNGLLLDDDALARLRELDVDPTLRFSYDGVGSHDSMRGGPAEAATVAAMRRAVAAGRRIAVTSSADATSASGIAASLELLVGIGVHSWHVSAPVPHGRWVGSTTALSLAVQAELSEDILRRWLALGRPFPISLFGMYDGASGVSGPARKPPRRCTPEDLHCGEPLTEAVWLMPDARLVPCTRVVDTPLRDAMPSLLDAGLSEAWQDPALCELAGVTKAEMLARTPECAVCDDFGECGGGCWASAFARSGDVFGRDLAACELWRSGERIRLAIIAGDIPALEVAGPREEAACPSTI